MMRHVLSPIKTCWRDRNGNAAVEFALLLPVLIFLIAGTVDLGLGFQQKAELQSALNSGMQHVIQTQGADLEKSRDVIRFSLGANMAAGIDVKAFCKCGSKTVECKTTCSAGMDRYAGATVSRAYRSPIFNAQSLLSASFEIYLGKAK